MLLAANVIVACNEAVMNFVGRQTRAEVLAHSPADSSADRSPIQRTLRRSGL